MPKRSIAASAIVGLVLALALSISSRADADARESPNEVSAARTARETDTRMVVVFHPEIFRCEPQEARSVRALRRLEEAMADLEIVTVFPEEGPAPAALYGEPLPGRRVELSSAAFREEGLRAPRPRLEVWDRQGRVLLLLGLHSAITEDEIYERVFWSRAFTKPVGE